MKLGVNVDHVATLRQARLGDVPDPVVAAMLSEYAGATSIVAHLREDRRHIRERDILLIKKAVKIPLNMEMSINKDIVDFACEIKPVQSTLVPERRQELTTEGGIDLIGSAVKMEKVIQRLKDKGIEVSVFIDPDVKQVIQARRLGADIIEFNTGKYSEAKNKHSANKELTKIKTAVKAAYENKFFVAAGHGLDYENVLPIAAIKEIQELNIGHSIISRAVFVGMPAAVEEMLVLIGG
jgi:pyridoxine 5-phosphate synthase